MNIIWRFRTWLYLALIVNMVHIDEWHLYKPVSVQENKTHKTQWGFEIQMDHPIPTRRPDLVIFQKKIRILFLVDSQRGSYERRKA